MGSVGRRLYGLLRRPRSSGANLSAEDISVTLDPEGAGLFDGAPTTMSLQALVEHLNAAQLSINWRVTDESPGGRLRTRSTLTTDYQRLLGVNDVGASGFLNAVLYGSNRPGGDAGGYVNANVILALVRGSSDPGNEIGGCIATMQLGVDGDTRPVYATLWGSSYTMRGFPGEQPGGLMAYTAVVQNYFDGSGSRSPNYGYAAVTRPGIGDGSDFWNEPGVGFRYARTYPVDFGFIVCGDSGEYPQGGDVGYRVAFQAGGEASPWAHPGDWRTRIGTGLIVRDWLEGGIHVLPAHRDADERAPHIRLDAVDTTTAAFLECRVEGVDDPVAAVRSDGRVTAARAVEPDDLVTKAQLDDAAMTAAQAGEWHSVGAPNGPPWQGGWTASGDRGPRFYREGSRVHLELSVTGGGSDSVAFSLPSDFRPAEPVLTVGAAMGSDPRDLRPALLRITTEGDIMITYPSGFPNVVASVSWRLVA